MKMKMKMIGAKVEMICLSREMLEFKVKIQINSIKMSHHI